MDTGEKKYTSSITGASMNFINSIIGSGIIGTILLSYVQHLLNQAQKFLTKCFQVSTL